MTTNKKAWLLLFCTLSSIIITLMFKPNPQDSAYHQFADQRKIAGIPNFFNVVSNLPFLFVGAYGLLKVKSSKAPSSILYMYSILFLGIFLTAFGSAFYHYRPDNNSLVYDRIPMTLVFMAFFSFVITTWINMKTGTLLLIPLLMIGISSVIYWHYSELKGRGDLRFYAFIQYFPIIIIPLIFLLFKNPYKNKGLFLLGWVFGWYIIAKLLEIFDKSIYIYTNIISGHSLKHIAAALATWYIVKFFEFKYLKNKTSSASL